MKTTIHRPLAAALLAAFAASVPLHAVAATGNIYYPLPEACRLLDSRKTAGPLTQSASPYKFGTSNSDVLSAGQGGNAAGCGIPPGISAITVSINMISPTASGNIRAWSVDAGTIGPTAGTAVYNHGLNYNGGFATIPVGVGDVDTGKFYLSVDNGEMQMTINVMGYWSPAG